MKLLVDTHVLIWGMTDSDRMPPDVAAVMANSDNTNFVSVVCLWEIAIKTKLGKLAAPDDFLAIVNQRPGYQILPVSAEHAWRVRTLPMIHRDPFDQLLVAQALIEDMTIVTHDPMMARYGVPVIAV